MSGDETPTARIRKKAVLTATVRMLSNRCAHLCVAQLNKIGGIEEVQKLNFS